MYYNYHLVFLRAVEAVLFVVKSSASKSINGVKNKSCLYSNPVPM